jgi:gliding motility-associated-like protein|tara:strand:- start:149 stop:973 length:825 start_codon:yes stop_codon:yes gene_type:complete
MKNLLIVIYLVVFSTFADAQVIGDYQVIDYLASAIHPNGCNSDYVIGPPDDSTWVNFDANKKMSGTFTQHHKNYFGNELLLETSFHRDNYKVRLILSSGLFSKTYYVQLFQWIQLPKIDWYWTAPGCDSDTSHSREHLILPLDFETNFGITDFDTVIGIEIEFLKSAGASDLAGVYVVSKCPTNQCESAIQMPNVITPNQDGFNDTFSPIHSLGIVSMHTTIYNRWGEKLYDTSNLNIEWEAKKEVAGTYFWIINYTDEKGINKTLSGHVEVIK